MSSDVLAFSMPSSTLRTTDGRFYTSEQAREQAVFASGARAILEDVFADYLGGVP